MALLRTLSDYGTGFRRLAIVFMRRDLRHHLGRSLGATDLLVAFVDAGPAPVHACAAAPRSDAPPTRIISPISYEIPP